MEQRLEHLDSQRLVDEEKTAWADYLIKLDDTEAVEVSPFRKELEVLRDFGLTEIVIGHPPADNEDFPFFGESIHEWFVLGIKTIPNTEHMVAENLGGDLAVITEITEDGSPRLQFAFGGGDLKNFDTGDINADIWDNLTSIHKTLSETVEGHKIFFKDQM